MIGNSSESTNAISHANKRNRRIALTGTSALLARGVQIGTSLITVPLTLKYLGTERFGLWITISSVLAMAAFADFGIGNGVLNATAQALGRDDKEGIRRAISSGFAILSIIALSLLSLFFAVYPLINWANFFKVVTPQAKTEAGPALVAFAVCFALNIVLDVVQRVQLGIQEGYRYGLWQMAGSIAGLMGVLVGIWMHASLPMLVIAIAGAPVVATFFNTVHFFGFSRRDLRPSSRLISQAMILQIARLGSLFFVLQVVVALAYSADNFIIARALGALTVPEYAIPQRLFSVISMIGAMLLTPLWPAYGEAVSRGDLLWVRRTLRQSLLIVFGGSAIAALVLLLLSRILISWWVGPGIQPPFLLLLGLAVWSIVDCSGHAIAMFLNGASIMKFQIMVASVFGVCCVTAKVVLVKKYGFVAVPWATIVTYGLLSALPCLSFIPRILRNLESRSTAFAPIKPAFWV